MGKTIQEISLPNLAFAFIPVLVVVVVLYCWSVNGRTALYAVLRMLIQLMLIGYVLTFIFESNSALIVIGVLTVMLGAASWISLRPVRHQGKTVYLKALASIALGGVLTLALITQAVLNVDTWYEPHVVIPLAGMLFSNSMNSVSLAAERYEAETKQGAAHLKARHVALNTALIPLVNSLFAVGIVAIPGMMTGQILSGVDPLVAARYQVMVMCMVFGAAGISATCYLALIKPRG